jgi:8-oxo-dGTP pyrophosphatase MutT (NUDIX family)
MPARTIDQFKTLANRLDAVHGLDRYSREHRLAAVLILIYPGPGGLRIVLTRRSDNLPTHAGQISFPGGTVDDLDPDPVHTALREAREEIGLESTAVEVLGILDESLLPSGYAVAPVLAVTETEPALTANPAEVADIFSIPLSLVADLDQYNRDFVIRGGEKREFFFLEYEDYYIWGATAKMLRTLALYLDESPPR